MVVVVVVGGVGEMVGGGKGCWFKMLLFSSDVFILRGELRVHHFLRFPSCS